jgi:hypothetical protein
MNVTTEILRQNNTYSASDNTNPDRYSSSKSLNYATGASISKAEVAEVNVVPFSLQYEDAVGLFGVENHFIKVKLNIIGDIVLKEYLEPGYIKADIDFYSEEDDTGYVTSSLDQAGAESDPGYSSAATPPLTLPAIGSDSYLSVDLENLKASNIYNNSYLDVRLYTSENEEHPYDKMYIKPRDFFYVGIHARNTKRLPYKIQIDVGNEYKSLESIEDKSYIMRLADRPSF